MASDKQIKQRINTTKNISKITKAMEMVSASKMKKAQNRALSARSYSQALRDSLISLAETIDPGLHPLLKPNESGIELAMIISTDRGLCGNLNQSLLKELATWLKNKPKAEILAVGKKSIAFAKFYGLTIHAEFDSIPDDVTTSDIVAITKMVTDGYLNQTYKSVELFYMDFVNTLKQVTTHLQLLPLKPPIDEDIHAHEQKYQRPTKSDFIFEPSPKEILNDLLPYYIENLVYQSFLENKASEHSARMVTMKNASENANELMSELQLAFNKTRQAAITSELLDITTATLSLSN